MARCTFLAVLAAGLFATAGCGDDGGNPTVTPDADTTGGGADTSVTDTTVGDNDTTVVDNDTTGGGDTQECNCGTRECGTFAGCDCGTCTPPQSCNAAGRCEQPGAPMGSFCGITATCNENAANYPDCIDDQCASKNCLASNRAAVLIRDVCTTGCQFYKDDVAPFGVEDPDSPQTDCNPADIVDGPAGNAYVCVNYAGPDQTPLGICTPGSTFSECNKDADCPADEGCELTTIGGDYNFRCVANYRAGDWGDTVGLSESCNDDPGAGDVHYCESGLCFGLGCVTLCNDGDDAACDTTKVYPDTGCDTTAGTCKGKPGVSCTSDLDCSGWECGEGRQILGDGAGGLAGPTWQFCWPKSCDIDNDCGAGFYCRFFWNGELGDAAGLDSSCLAQNPEGVGLGEACDDNPNDAIPGAVCANEDLCVGGYCSALCGANEDCADSQRCEVAELPGDTDDDGTLEFVLPLSWCIDGSRDMNECLSDAECGADEQCEIYEIENLVDDGNGNMVLDDDAPYIMTGACAAKDAQLQPWGGTCTGAGDCQSGYCLGATATQPGFCTKVCGASSECESVSIGGEDANGTCSPLLLAWGGALDDPRVNLYLPACVLTLSSNADCSADYTCAAANEACTPNAIAVTPDKPGTVEYICQALYDPDNAPSPLPTKAVGEACDPDSEDYQCASGVCLTDKDGNGYCSGLCKASDTPPNADLTCQTFTNIPRKGAYTANSPSFMMWQKDRECRACDGDWMCADGDVCANLGGNGASADFRCVPACTDQASCSDATVTTACSETVDPFGDAVMGCFEKTTAPVNYCASN